VKKERSVSRNSLDASALITDKKCDKDLVCSSSKLSIVKGESDVGPAQSVRRPRSNHEAVTDMAMSIR